jgi:hypothetical protein
VHERAGVTTIAGARILLAAVKSPRNERAETPSATTTGSFYQAMSLASSTFNQVRFCSAEAGSAVVRTREMATK